MDRIEEILTSGQPPADVSNAPILTPQQLEAFTAGKPFDEAIVFETSGSMGRPKRIPYSKHSQDIQQKRQGEVFRRGGLIEDDVILNLGAPLEPHHSQSAWIIERGANALGATVANSSYEDYESVIETGHSQRVTVVCGQPQAMRAIGQRIEATYGSLTRIFPAIRMGATGGGLVTAHLRANLKNLWGFEKIQNNYATTEGGEIAAAPDDTNRLLPVEDDSLILELLPERNDTYGPIPVDIHDIEEVTSGALLVSDLERDIVPIVRYRVGDIVTVYPDAPRPRIEVLGREGETMLVGGALVYPSQIDGALAETYPASPPEWVAVVSQPDGISPALDIYVLGESLVEKPDAVRQQLFDRSSPVKVRDDLDILDHLDIHYTTQTEIDTQLQAFDLVNEVLGEGPKTGRVGFDRSYEGVIE